MEFPRHLFFTKDHEWVSDDSDEFNVGISAYAIEQLGDIVYLELPAIGDIFASKESFGTVESVKTVSDLYAPVSGEAIAVNEALIERPELVNSSPYGEGWLLRVRVADASELEALLDAAAYRALLPAG